MRKKIERTDWLEGFSPQPSSLHPTIFVLRKLLTSSFKMKIELEGGATKREESNSIFDDFYNSSGPPAEAQAKDPVLQLSEDYDKIFKSSLYYYLHMKTPVFALLKLIKYDTKVEDLSDLTRLLTKLYFDQLIYEGIEQGDWANHFPILLKKVQEVCADSSVFKFDRANEHIESELSRLKNPKLQAAWLLAIGKPELALRITENLSLQVPSADQIQSLSLYLIRSNNFELKAKDTWENILCFAEELSNCLLLLEAKSETFQRRKNTHRYSLYVSSNPQAGQESSPQSNSPQSSDVIIKDSLGLDEFNYFEKTVVIATQISYVIYLVAINLGAWGRPCD